MSLTDLRFGLAVIWRRSAAQSYAAEIVDIEHTGGKVQIRARVPDEARRLWWVRLDELESTDG
jgi:hypothetical protein